MRAIGPTWVVVILEVFAAACGDEPRLGRDVEFVHPDEIEDPAVAAAASGVVKLSLYDHLGTGFFISGNGYLLTNDHVAGVRECPDECTGLTIHYRQERGAEQTVFEGARLVFSDEDIDVALLKVEVEPGGVAFVRLAAGDPDQPVAEGWPVHITGHPFGTLKKDTVGPLEFRSGADYVIDNFAFPGNSGSPLLGPWGKAIGLVKAIYYRIGDITLDGVYGESGIAATMDRILEKYPFLTALNVTSPNAAAEDALWLAVDQMADGKPSMTDEALLVDVDTLGRGEIDAALALLANSRAGGAFEVVRSIWDRAQNREIFEEDHRYLAGLALRTLATTAEEKATALDLLSGQALLVDTSWLESYLRMVHDLGTEESVAFSQEAAVTAYGGYELTPWLASLFLSFGIRSVHDLDLIAMVEQDLLDFDSSHFRIALNLDKVRFTDPDDEARVVKILQRIIEGGSRVRGIFWAEQALYNRGRINLP